MPIIVTPYIPTYITVHLGTPDSDAENLTISFREYIKNVASSEVYPTWHNSALRANILAQVSFALNRVYGILSQSGILFQYHSVHSLRSKVHQRKKHL